MKRDFMVSMELFFEGIFMFPTILASVTSSFANFITDKFPPQTSLIGHTALPIWMLIASVCFTAKLIIALPRAEMVILTFPFLSTCETNRLTTYITRHYGDSGIISRHLFATQSPEINSIAGSRTSPSDFSLLAVSNEFFSAEFAYQLRHNYIIPQYASFNKTPDYRRREIGRWLWS